VGDLQAHLFLRSLRLPDVGIDSFMSLPVTRMPNIDLPIVDR